MEWEQKVKKLKQELDEIQDQLTEADKLHPKKRSQLFKKQGELSQILDLYREWQEKKDELNELEELSEEESDLGELADEEAKTLKQNIQGLEQKLKKAFEPKHPDAEKDAILEIRAGAGGDEAALFAGDLLRMYLRFAEEQGWKTEILSSNKGETGGYKEVVVEISDSKVFDNLRFESGVHRVQRVPETESKGRVHTSTATVAVLPVAEDVDLEIDENNLRIDRFRASGHGGQSVNTTASAVRITHLPTDTVVSIQSERSQGRNKEKAMEVLRTRLLEKRRKAKEQDRDSRRRQQIGTGDRSEKIRTYNFPQNRVTDHRINESWHNLEEVIDGEIEDLISKARQQWVKKASE